MADVVCMADGDADPVRSGVAGHPCAMIDVDRRPIRQVVADQGPPVEWPDRSSTNLA